MAEKFIFQSVLTSAMKPSPTNTSNKSNYEIDEKIDIDEEVKQQMKKNREKEIESKSDADKTNKQLEQHEDNKEISPEAPIDTRGILRKGVNAVQEACHSLPGQAIAAFFPPARVLCAVAETAESVALYKEEKGPAESNKQLLNGFKSIASGIGGPYEKAITNTFSAFMAQQSDDRKINSEAGSIYTQAAINVVGVTLAGSKSELLESALRTVDKSYRGDEKGMNKDMRLTAIEAVSSGLGLGIKSLIPEKLNTMQQTILDGATGLTKYGLNETMPELPLFNKDKKTPNDLQDGEIDTSKSSEKTKQIDGKSEVMQTEKPDQKIILSRKTKTDENSDPTNDKKDVELQADLDTLRFLKLVDESQNVKKKRNALSP